MFVPFFHDALGDASSSEDEAEGVLKNSLLSNLTKREVRQEKNVSAFFDIKHRFEEL